MRSFVTLILFILAFSLTNGQVITAEPVTPTADDSVTIYYDASQGNKGLMNFAGNVYAHTGLITDESSSGSDWQHAPTWGDNSSKYKLQRVSANLYKFRIAPSIRSFYGAASSEKILKLAFVFRSEDKTKEGKDVGNTDIFYDVYEQGVSVILDSPTVSTIFADLNDTIIIKARSFKADSLFFYVGSKLKTATDNDSLRYELIADSYGVKRAYIIAKDSADNTVVDSFMYVVNYPLTVAMPPGSVQYGINYLSETSVILELYAPGKKFAYVIGDFNNWQIDSAYYMTLTPDQSKWWLQIDNLTPGQEYGFQYYVDGEIKIPDPYTEKVLDPWNDGEIISKNIYPNLKPYPAGKTAELVSVLQTAKPAYQWQVENFQRPSKEKLVVYELLLRDFLAAHDFSTLIDTLGYLERLGVNAIELMPVNEFEGNLSWGYNPSLYFCVDKYYGPEYDFKRFVDEAHKRGIAVIMDMVLNHQAGQSPLVRLYNEGNYGTPTADNPWFNTVAKHPYNVFYDMNHESSATQLFVDRVNEYWLKEYKVDGFRYDLSKGFTQKNSGSNVDAWGAYDQSRINILKRMYDKIRLVDSTAYVILEHFADNSEEKVLSGYGMMLWGNMNYNYNEGTMGYVSGSDVSWGYYANRAWTAPNLVSYMESHDEERLMYKNLQYGNSSGSYNIKNLNIALGRNKLAAAFFFPIPGPKMIWQFGELGYDYSINYPSGTGDDRTNQKPIKWDYYSNSERLKLYKVFSHLINLKKNYAAFNSPDSVKLNLAAGLKTISLMHKDMNAYIIGNFTVAAQKTPAEFPAIGKWYDYFTGDSLELSAVKDTFDLKPGEFRLYTSVKLEGPVDEGLLIGVESIDNNNIPEEYSLSQNYPNPFNPVTTIRFTMPKSGAVTLKIYNILGQEVKTLINKEFSAGSYEARWNGDTNFGDKAASGVYIYRLEAGSFKAAKKMLLLK
jgi:1,4-alpha-glucan branching enzyme